MEELRKIRGLLEKVVELLRKQIPDEEEEKPFGRVIGRTLDGTPVFDSEWLSLEDACRLAKEKKG